jgi:phenylpropionate dioxygenase-like ring-hydroxylating dioxygenase large terminal subunit
MAEPVAAPIDPEVLELVLRPFEQARTLPGAAYGSTAVFEWERRHFFEGSWVCVGRTDDLSQAGDQKALAIGERSVLLVRGDDGELRGFHNVCRHRGHELLAVGETRNARGVKCPYHAWVYGLEGDLRAAPRFDLPHFDKTGFPLVPARVAEWHGWVFVNASGDAPSFEEHIGNLGMAVEDYRPERLRVGASHEYVVRANWKIVIENYLECYHCSSIHPELCEVTPPDSDHEYPEASNGVWVGGPMVLRDHAVTMSLTGQSSGVPIPSVPERKLREVGYAALLPNLLISPHPDYLMTHRLVPLSERETWVECAWLFPPEAFEHPGFTPDYAREFWDITNREDWGACESVQRNVTSPGYRQGPISSWEIDVWREMAVLARGYLEGRLLPFDVMLERATS